MILPEPLPFPAGLGRSFLPRIAFLVVALGPDFDAVFEGLFALVREDVEERLLQGRLLLDSPVDGGVIVHGLAYFPEGFFDEFAVFVACRVCSSAAGSGGGCSAALAASRVAEIVVPAVVVTVVHIFCP